MGAYRGHSPNFLDVVRRLFRGGPPNKCQGAKIYPRTKRGDTVNYQLARTRLLGHTSVRYESHVVNVAAPNHISKFYTSALLPQDRVVVPLVSRSALIQGAGLAIRAGVDGMKVLWRCHGNDIVSVDSLLRLFCNSYYLTCYIHPIFVQSAVHFHPHVPNLSPHHLSIPS